MTDFTQALSECKTDTARANFIREAVSKFLETAFQAEFGEDMVIRADIEFETKDEVKFAKNSVIVAVGQTPNKDGAMVDTVIEVTAKVKPWNTAGKKKAVNLDDVAEGLAIAKKPKDAE